MINSIKKVDFSSIRNAIPNFLTIILMPLTYSITDGIGLGIITYVIIDLIIYIIDKIKGDKKAKLNINLITIIVAILFIIYFLIRQLLNCTNLYQVLLNFPHLSHYMVSIFHLHLLPLMLLKNSLLIFLVY